MTCLLYAEGELDGDALRETEAHLVTCRDCRVRIVALRDEAVLLGQVMREERPAAVAAAVPDSGVALGVPLAIAAVTVAIAASSALIDARLPGALDLLHPRRLKGAAEMAFDMIFLMRENAPGLVELAFSVGVVASLSAIGSFAVSALSRRLFDGAAILCLGALLFAPEPAAAFAAYRDEDVRIAAGVRIEESLVAHGGDRVDIDGVVDGDLIAAAERVTIRGEVTGSLYVFCRDLEITGKVAGAVHAISESTRVEGEIGGRVYASGEDFTLSRTSWAKSDVNLFAEDVVVEGSVGRDIHIAGDRLDVGGEVGRHIHALWLDELTLRDAAHVHGDVDVRLTEGRDLDRAPGARVEGEVRAEEGHMARDHYLSHYQSWRFYAIQLLWFASAFLFGLLVYLIGPRMFRGSIDTSGDLFRTLGLGFVVLVTVPVAIIAAALTIIGIPVAVSALFLYIVALYGADLAIAAWLGRVIAAPADDSLLAFGRSFGLGLAILAIIGMVPFLGPPIGFVALLLGLGLIAARAWEALGYSSVR
jgi:cytoskeletal protein CcmA (bactofilin family)